MYANTSQLTCVLSSPRTLLRPKDVQAHQARVQEYDQAHQARVQEAQGQPQMSPLRLLPLYLLPLTPESLHAVQVRACVHARSLPPSHFPLPHPPTQTHTFSPPHLPLPLFLLTTVFAYADGPNRGNIKRRGSATDVAAGQVSFGDPVNECLTLPVPHSYSSLCC